MVKKIGGEFRLLFLGLRCSICYNIIMSSINFNTPRCPGQDQGYWKPEDIFDEPCPFCGTEIEIWKDEPMRLCPDCKKKSVIPGSTLAALSGAGMATNAWENQWLTNRGNRDLFTREYNDHLLAETQRGIQ